MAKAGSDIGTGNVGRRSAVESLRRMIPSPLLRSISPRVASTATATPRGPSRKNVRQKNPSALNKEICRECRNRHTSAPILVLNARNDPATPLQGAYAGASQLSQALVVVTATYRAAKKIGPAQIEMSVQRTNL
jgi:hypothetical protein